MATRTLKRSKPKPRQNRLPLPESADVATIAGRDFLIMPLEDFDEWYEDRILAQLAIERLERQEHLAIPFEEIEKRLDRRRKD